MNTRPPPIEGELSTPARVVCFQMPLPVGRSMQWIYLSQPPTTTRSSVAAAEEWYGNSRLWSR
jgi:hypothetical protein